MEEPSILEQLENIPIDQREMMIQEVESLINIGTIFNSECYNKARDYMQQVVENSLSIPYEYLEKGYSLEDSIKLQNEECTNKINRIYKEQLFKKLNLL